MRARTWTPESWALAVALVLTALAGCTTPVEPGDERRGDGVAGQGLASGEGLGGEGDLVGGDGGSGNGSSWNPDGPPYPNATYHPFEPDQCAEYEVPGKVVASLHLPWEEPEYGWGKETTWIEESGWEDMEILLGGSPAYYASPELPSERYYEERVDVVLIEDPGCIVFDEFTYDGPDDDGPNDDLEYGVILRVTHPSSIPECYWWGSKSWGFNSEQIDVEKTVEGHFTLTIDHHRHRGIDDSSNPPPDSPYCPRGGLAAG